MGDEEIKRNWLGRIARPVAVALLVGGIPVGITAGLGHYWHNADPYYVAQSLTDPFAEVNAYFFGAIAGLVTVLVGSVVGALSTNGTTAYIRGAFGGGDGGEPAYLLNADKARIRRIDLGELTATEKKVVDDVVAIGSMLYRVFPDGRNLYQGGRRSALANWFDPKLGCSIAEAVHNGRAGEAMQILRSSREFALAA
jgi:hypothetical protein